MGAVLSMAASDAGTRTRDAAFASLGSARRQTEIFEADRDLLIVVRLTLGEETLSGRRAADAMQICGRAATAICEHRGLSEALPPPTLCSRMK